MTRRAERGATLWIQDTPPRGLHVLVEGRVRAVRAHDGREAVLHRSGPGTTLGEIPLFDGGTYPATVVAETDVRLLVLDRRTLEAAMRLDVELAWLFLASLSARVRDLAGRLEARTAVGVRCRLARHLRARVAAEGDRGFGLGATQDALARDLGSVREVVARHLGALVREGVLARAGRARFDLLDARALDRIASQAGG